MRNRIIDLIEAEALYDSRIVFLTGDLGFSVVEPLQAALGARFLNMGVAEANMISVAASLAATGLRPLAYSITPFISSRCFEQIRNDVVYQRRAVRLIGVGSGFSYGGLGPSHHGLEDANIMASLPELIVLNPANVSELDRVYALAREEERASYFRIARESGVDFSAPLFTLDAAAYLVREGSDATLIGSGVGVAECLRAADLLAREGVAARVVSVPVIAPFPKEALAALIGDEPVVSVFEGFPGNPFSFGVMAALFETGFRNAHVGLTVPHRFEHVVGDTEFLRARAGLDAGSIASAARRLVAGAAAPRARARA